MNIAETDLATKILNAAADTASRQDAGNTLLFVEAYDKLVRTGIMRIDAFEDAATRLANTAKTTLETLVTNGCPKAEVVEASSSSAALPDLGEPTPIQPIPAPTKRNRRTQAQIEADNAAAAQATAPAAAEPEPALTVHQKDGLSTGDFASVAEVPESAAPPEGIDGITLSTLFKTILSSKEEPDKTTFKNAVRAKLEAVGIPQISKLTPEHFESFNTFLLSFKA